MPTLRTDIKKSKFSNYGKSVFSPNTKNTQYFQKRQVKQPTVRGSFPKAVRWSLDDEGVKNSRLDYRRSMDLKRSARRANNRNASYSASKKIASVTFNSNIYAGATSASNVRLSNINYFTGGKSSVGAIEGNVARKITPKVAPKKTNVSKPNLNVLRGEAKQKNIFQTTALSPMLVTLTKVAAAVIVVIAIMAFVRVAMTSATVSTGLATQQISAQIDNELISKNGLEVQDSALSNSSRLRQAASQFNLVAPASVETINLEKDILDYQGNKVSLVGSLNNIANNAK